jgi:hypothetical protein
MENKFILDACCSVRAMWSNKQHPNTLYIDIRKEPLGFGRKEMIDPDIIMDFRKMDFPDNKFKLVVFEPPHLKTLGESSYFRKKFGCLNAETWQDDLKRGFSECWRVLEDYGVLIFKWSDNEVKFKEVLKLAPTKPLFYNTSNNKATSTTKWFCFMKIPVSQDNAKANSTREKVKQEIDKDYGN